MRSSPILYSTWLVTEQVRWSFSLLVACVGRKQSNFMLQYVLFSGRNERKCAKRKNSDEQTTAEQWLHKHSYLVYECVC